MQGLGERIPLFLANMGQACYQCFKEKSADNPLQRCAGCFHVHYCGTACQRANWSKHKGLCKAYKAFEANHGRDLLAPYIFLDDDEETMVATDINQLNKLLSSLTSVKMGGLAMELRRPLRMDESNLVGWEPHCLACGRSDAIFRIEAFLRNRKPASSGLKPCSDCRFSFYCSEEHWEAVKAKHRQGPCQDGRDGLSQCDMNKLCLEDVRFAETMAGANTGEFKWAPERTVASWSSLRGVDWGDFAPALEEALGQRLGLTGRTLEPMLRGATEILSMPMTILWGLENLNSDDAWTRKDTLNIHVLGAADKEVANSQMFEEILHRLPLVNILKLTFCGPELEGITGRFPRLEEMDTCPKCSRNGRKRIHDHHAKTYHDYITSQGTKYTKPDLAIAFDSGCSQEAIESWKKTLAVLAQPGIPTLFTAFNQEEAEAEAELLRQAGATLHPGLGPRHNPWGSLLSKTEPNKVTGFYAVNGWLAGGFR